MRLQAKNLLLLTLLFLLVTGAFSASAKADALPNCPDIADVSSLSVGDTLTAYTVTKGETIESFSVEVLGIQQNAFLPGHSIVIGKASGGPVDLAGGGIAAGMSGSPVYTSGGELVGAIAYGFSSSPSPITGITPATDMQAGFAKKVPLSAPIQKRAARSLGRSAPSSLSQIPLVFSSSGRSLSPRMAEYFKKNNIVFSGAPGSRSSRSSALFSPARDIPVSSDLHAGDTLTAYSSIGDTATGGLGTATYVCNGDFLGFGHPMFDSGADAPVAFAGKGDVYGYVVDLSYGPFKYGVFTEAVGSVSSDSPWAIGGTIGELPPSYEVAVSVENKDTGTSQQTSTQVVSMPPISDKSYMEPYAISNAVYSTMQAESGTGYWGGGSAQADIVLSGVSRRGPWQVSYSDHFDLSDSLSSCYAGFFCYANPGSVSELLSGAVLQWASRYSGLGIEITDVDINVVSSEQRDFYNIIGAQWSQDGKTWYGGTARVDRGKKFFVRLRMRDQNGDVQYRAFPMKAKGSGAVRFSSNYLLDPFFGMPEPYYYLKSFPGVVDYINGLPRMDRLALKRLGNIHRLGGSLAFDTTLTGQAFLSVTTN